MTKRRSCGFCGRDLPDDARPNRLYCDDNCRKGRVPGPVALPDLVDDVEIGEVEAEFEAAVELARSEERLGVLDGATVAAARVLARKIDEEQARWDYCFEWAERWDEWSRQVEGVDAEPPKSPPKPPPMDNVSLPTFLRYCEALGLTPGGAGRAAGGVSKETGSGSRVSGLAGRVPRPAS